MLWGLMGMKEMSLLYSNEITLENERKMKLRYFLIERVLPAEQKPIYGVKIEKYLDGAVESDEVTGVSDSKEIVLSIIKKLFQYEVTPISMVEIIDDMITLECY